MDPSDEYINAQLAFAYYGIGDYQSARVACESANEGNQPGCFAYVYDKLGRRADAEAALASLRAKVGDDRALGYADIYLAWGDRARSLDWLVRALKFPN